MDVKQAEATVLAAFPGAKRLKPKFAMWLERRAEVWEFEREG